MDMRARVNDALKSAMKAKEPVRLSTLRLINAAIKDRDIAVRGEGQEDGVGDADVLQILGKMVKQRQESARAYEEAGGLSSPKRNARKSRSSKTSCPSSLTMTRSRRPSTRKSTGAASSDMGIMGALKKYTGRMDFGPCPMVKSQLDDDEIAVSHRQGPVKSAPGCGLFESAPYMGQGHGSSGPA